jgi:tellurite methyltransferase
MTDWSRYYAAAGDEPRGTLLHALDLFDAEPPPAGPRLAVDLGCGTGRDTAELLRRGWDAFAIDAETEAIERLRVRPEAAAAGARLRTEVAAFEDARWPAAHLVNASFSLPFCAPDAFARVWTRIERSLLPGGRFCGQLFGDRDEWARDGLTVQTRAEAEALFAGFDLDRFDEVEEDGATAVGAAKHWHVFHVVARRVRDG